MDVHLPKAITEQLRLRGVDVLTVIEDGRNEAEDEDLLERARELGRLLVTQDIRFRVQAEEWQRVGRPFSGLLYGDQTRGSIGEYVETLHLIAEASDAHDWENVIHRIPY
jgi:predicted nuclease of predicted toxin-antitoxin system